MESEIVLKIVAIACGSSIAIVAILAGAVKNMTRTRAIERSRRELSAYVAEGSIAPEEAERMLEAGPKHSTCNGRDKA